MYFFLNRLSKNRYWWWKCSDCRDLGFTISFVFLRWVGWEESNTWWTCWTIRPSRCRGTLVAPWETSSMAKRWTITRLLWGTPEVFQHCSDSWGSLRIRKCENSSQVSRRWYRIFIWFQTSILLWPKLLKTTSFSITFFAVALNPYRVCNVTDT